MKLNTLVIERLTPSALAELVVVHEEVVLTYSHCEEEETKALVEEIRQAGKELRELLVNLVGEKKRRLIFLSNLH